ncbi:hypothetical protein OIO90_003199 [Microbotryomycetes sp. JL221]|nr:hypothetical protein OIO90_003199 [Microbotryomycetes sp. JL221]
MDPLGTDLVLPNPKRGSVAIAAKLALPGTLNRTEDAETDDTHNTSSAAQAWRTGEALWFNQTGTDTGACKRVHTNDDLLFGLSATWYGPLGDISPHCGRMVEVEHVESGKTLTLPVTDSSGNEYFTLSIAAFRTFAPLRTGLLDIKWRFVDGQSTSSPVVVVSSGAHNSTSGNSTVSAKPAGSVAVPTATTVVSSRPTSSQIETTSIDTKSIASVSAARASASSASAREAQESSESVAAAKASREAAQEAASSSSAAAARASAEAAAEQKKQEEAAAREKAAREQQEREERERREREQAERDAAAQQAKEEAERKAKEDADRKAKEEADRKAREDADRKAKEEADRKAAEAAANNGGGGGGGQVFRGGYATYYMQNGNPGHCGTVAQESDYVIALPTHTYANGAHCGKRIRLTRTDNGRSVTATVRDSCPTCVNNESLDLSQGAFTAIAEEWEGMVPIEWTWA